MSRVTWFREAREDLRHIGDVIVIAQIVDLAERELDLEPTGSSIEGTLPDDPRLKWRRCIGRAERSNFESFDPDERDGEYRVDPCDYVLAYRAITADEAINQRRTEDIIVVRVLSNTQLATLVRAGAARRRAPSEVRRQPGQA